MSECSELGISKRRRHKLGVLNWLCATIWNGERDDLETRHPWELTRVVNCGTCEVENGWGDTSGKQTT